MCSLNVPRLKVRGEPEERYGSVPAARRYGRESGERVTSRSYFGDRLKGAQEAWRAYGKLLYGQPSQLQPPDPGRSKKSAPETGVD